MAFKKTGIGTSLGVVPVDTQVKTAEKPIPTPDPELAKQHIVRK